jgi:hypothetical protein
MSVALLGKARQRTETAWMHNSLLPPYKDEKENENEHEHDAAERGHKACAGGSGRVCGGVKSGRRGGAAIGPGSQ